jgi:ABC-type polysaccharide/polyol phosphate transport system ATPase subunit
MYVDSDIILLDEFFGGVGDLQFNKKSSKAFEEYILQNKTVINVSHNLSIIENYCDRALYLKEGKAIAIGNAKDIVKQYRSDFTTKPND